MAGFGGSVKLKGESEYRRALSQITQSLKVVSAEMRSASSSFESGDRSQEELAGSAEELKAALEKEKTALSTLKSQLATMQSEYSRTGQEHQELVNQYNREKAKLEEIKATYGETSSEYKQQQQVVDNLSQAVAKSQKAYDAQGRALNDMKIKTANAETTVNSTAAALDRLGNEAQLAATDVESASSGFTVMKGALANLAGNLLSSVVNGIQNLAGEAINSADALTKFESTMDFAGYSGSQIQKAKADMKEYADRTVYDLNTISNTTAQLAANGIPNYEKLTEAAGNLNAVAGGNSETFKSVAMMLTQTAGAGKLTTENWNQMADAIPGASGKVQEALKKNGAYTGNFRDAMSEGQISAEEFNKAIMDLGFTDAAKEAATSTRTFEGAMGNLQAAVVDGLMKIYNAVGSENITGFIDTLTNFISAIIPPIVDAVSWFVGNLPKIAPMLAGIAGGLTALLIVNQIQAMVEAFRAWKAATEGMTIAQRILNVVQSQNPVGLVIAGIAALVSAIIYLWNTNENFRTAIITVWNAIKSTIMTVVNGIKSFLTKAWSAIKSATTSAWNAIKTAVTTPIHAAKNVISNAVNGIKSTVTRAWHSIKSATSSAWNAIKNAITTPIEKAKSTVKNIINGIKDTVKNIFKGIKPKLHISLPHISVRGGKAPFGIGGKGHLPSFDVKWFAKGGVFDNATFAGIGEDGAEAVVPLEHNTQWIRRVADEMRTNLTSQALIPDSSSEPDYSSMIKAFKQALSEMKVELDDEEMGKFVDKTVTKLIYS